MGIRSFLIMVGKDAARKPPSQHLQEGGRRTRRVEKCPSQGNYGGWQCWRELESQPRRGFCTKDGAGGNDLKPGNVLRLVVAYTAPQSLGDR